MSRAKIWAFEDGVLDTFLDAKATVVDRTAILRLTSAESDSQAEFKKIEMDALRNHADIIVELLVSQSVDQPPIAEADNSKIADTSANESKNKSKYDSLIKCVVVVETSKAQGSGFFVTSEGHVVTNKHVVSDSDSVTVKTTDGVVWTGRVLQRASKHDLALIKIEGNSQNYLAIANSEEYKAGTETVAIGTPLGLEWSDSKGIVRGSDH